MGSVGRLLGSVGVLAAIAVVLLGSGGGLGCGDGIGDNLLGEECDDGNTSSGDGCSGDCLSDENYGNGALDTAVGEQCDDGNTAAGDGFPGAPRACRPGCARGVGSPRWCGYDAS
jgi:cysteine-rich repeat protein